MKYDFRKFYIGGEWALPSSPNDYQVINPATEEVVGVISLGSIDDAARAVAAAKAAFPEYSQTELWKWLEGGAQFYVCGDASRMAKDVDKALHQIIETNGGLTSEAANEYVQKLKGQKRYQRDVY